LGKARLSISFMKDSDTRVSELIENVLQSLLDNFQY